MYNNKWGIIRIFYMRKRSQTGGESLPVAVCYPGFAIYLNDLENCFNTSGCRGIEIDVQNNEFTIFVILFEILYANDTIIFSVGAKEFQDTLNAFNEYCKRWNLEINISKT